MEIVLSIAGSDPSAGAGIQQDLKTITAMHCYGATVITALTSQNTMGVQGVMPVPDDVVRSQLQSILSDLEVGAIKIGQIPNRNVAAIIAETLGSYLATHHIDVVYDPVMISTSGRRLMEENCIGYVSDHLFPLCSLITPNLPETEVLANRKATSQEEIDIAGKQLSAQYSTSFLLKGGHADSEMMTDRLYTKGETVASFESPRIESRNLHGTGCTLSSAIAAALAKGLPLAESVRVAKELVTRAIQQGQNLQIGKGNGPLWPL